MSGTSAASTSPSSEKVFSNSEKVSPESSEYGTPITCPPELELTEDQHANAAMGLGLSDATIHQVTVKFRGRYLGKGTRMALDRWRTALNTAVCNDGPALEIERRRAEAAGEPTREKSSRELAEEEMREAREAYNLE